MGAALPAGSVREEQKRKGMYTSPGRLPVSSGKGGHSVPERA